MEQARVIATIRTPYRILDGVECIGEAEAWIFGNDQTIKRIDIHENVMETVNTIHERSPGGISVTRERELIYSDKNSRTVNIVRDGRSETLINTLPGWKPWRLCSTSTGNILVHVHRGENGRRRNKLIRYQGQKNIQEINRDGQNNPIFSDGPCTLYLSENRNNDICVSNIFAHTVVVVDSAGRFRFQYDGNPANRARPFSPRGIVTNARRQIIVADDDNNCLHILDQNGHFLGCIDDCGLEKPCKLSVDSRGRLWVGCEGGRIIVIEYLRS